MSEEPTQCGLLLPYGDLFPKVAEDAFVAPTSVLIGDVTIGAGATVLFNCTLRGDVNFIRVGAQSNIQDGSTIHVTVDGSPTIIGDRVSVSHNVMLHACTLEDESFVGMSATVMDDCVIEKHGMLAAGAVLTPGKRIGRGELWSGTPAKLWRKLDEKQIEGNLRAWQSYYKYSRNYLAQGIGRVNAPRP